MSLCRYTSDAPLVREIRAELSQLHTVIVMTLSLSVSLSLSLSVSPSVSISLFLSTFRQSSFRRRRNVDNENFIEVSLGVLHVVEPNI